MALNVLIINPPYVGNSEIFYMPLGLGIIAAVAEREGCSVRVIDALNHHLDFEEIERRMATKPYDLLLMGGFAMQVNAMREITSRSRGVQPNAKVALGGVGVSDIPKIVIEYTGADAVATGECETTLPAMLMSIEHGRPFVDVPTFAYRAGNNIVVNPKGPVVEELDSLPWPAYHHFDIDFISPRSYNGEGKRSIHLMTSRGCPFRCDFCINSVLNDRHFQKELYGSVLVERPKATQRFRSPESLLKEISFLRNKYGITDFHFADEEFLTHKSRVFEICDALRPLGITWSTSGRADWASSEKLAAMSSAGCRYILFGVETGSQQMMNLMVKSAKVESVVAGLAAARDTGMNFIANFMIGHPGETDATVRETVEFCREEGLVFLPAYVTLFPNSKMFHEAKHQIKDWGWYFGTLEKINFVHKLFINLTDMPDSKLIALRNWSISMTMAYKIVGKDKKVLATIVRPFIEIGLHLVELAPTPVRQIARNIVVGLVSLRNGKGKQRPANELGQKPHSPGDNESVDGFEMSLRSLRLDEEQVKQRGLNND